MVRVKLNTDMRSLTLEAIVVTYGHASNPDITSRIAGEIEQMWNEPRGTIAIRQVPHTVIFQVEGRWMPAIEPETILANTDPRMNFFRVEEYAYGNISFVDGIGSNTGYFKLENLYAGSTTAAHEFGHGLGLDHPQRLDIRGMGRPGIMYPRGTWVDPAFQYDPGAAPGAPGGTMHPMHRRVLMEDIQDLRLDRLRFLNGIAVLGEFSNVFHPDHAGLPL
jgi:hypothetical protein